MVLQDTHLGCFSGFSSGALNSNQLPVETTWWCWLRTLKEQQQLPALSARTSSALYFLSAMYSSPTDISLPQMLLPCHNTQIPGSGFNAYMSPFEGACPKGVCNLYMWTFLEKSCFQLAWAAVHMVRPIAVWNLERTRAVWHQMLDHSPVSRLSSLWVKTAFPKGWNSNANTFPGRRNNSTLLMH